MGPRQRAGRLVDVRAHDRLLDLVDTDARRDQRADRRLLSAGLYPSNTVTWATPLTVEIRCARNVWAYSSTV